MIGGLAESDAELAVLDSGVIERATTDREFRDVLRILVADGVVPTIPTVVLAEVIRGEALDAPANLTLRRFGTVTTDERLARQAGRLRTAAARDGGRRVPSGIDAIVASHAVASKRSLVFTTDPSDLRRLVADHPHVRVHKP